MSELKPNGQRAKKAILWIWIVLAFEAVSCFLSCIEYGIYQSIINGVDVPEEVIDANDTGSFIVASLAILVFIISVVMFIKWFRRAYQNLHQSVSHRLLYSEGWAAGSWFVPILNIYRPYRIMKELYLETKKLLVKRGMDMNLSLATVFVGWWWALWIIDGILGRASWKCTMWALRLDTPEAWMTSAMVDIISGIAGIVLALITVKIIKDYSKAEALLAENQGWNTDGTD